MKKIIIILLIAFSFFIFTRQGVFADEIDDINAQLTNLKRDLQQSKDATAPLEKDLNRLTTELNQIKTNISSIEMEIVKKEREVKKGEETLAFQKNLLDQRVFSHYKNVKRSGMSLISLLTAENLSSSLKNFFYQKTLADKDKNSIIQIVVYIKNLEEKKVSLTSEKTRLAAVKKDVDSQSQLLTDEIGQAKEYQKELSGKIASLTARQQQLIASKLAALNIPRSAGTSTRGCSSDLTNGRDPGFSPRFGFFTYGAPHRRGMNQYGAWGRARAGQNEEQILSFYYPGMALKKDFDQGAQINVEGHGTFAIEDYVKRIYEVPDSWTDNNLAVLKAQAVAARTYALNTMQRRGSICTTEACQVFKPEPKGGNWEAAVNETAGWVLMEGDSPGFTQYASTHGGYIINLNKFDGDGGNPSSFEELNTRAYDRDSPWFYCNWGSRSQYGGTAWLKGEEVADIANVIMLARYSDVDKEHLYQTDKPNPAGKETWDAGKVRSELSSRGGNPIGSASDASVSVDFGSGKTNSISINGISFSGSEFKDWFNLRAPANIQIVGPLYNVEKR